MSNINQMPLERFKALLGTDVFFVPCEYGTKKPLVTYVDRPFEATQGEAYRAIFAAVAGVVHHELKNIVV